MKIFKFSSGQSLSNNLGELEKKAEFAKIQKGKWYSWQRVYIIKSANTANTQGPNNAEEYGMVSLNFFERLARKICHINIFKKEFKGKKISVVKLDAFTAKINSLQQRIQQEKQPQSPKVEIKVLSPIRKKEDWEDRQIRHRLQEQGFINPEHIGGGGSCLFFSVVHQVTDQDLTEAATFLNTPEETLTQEWSGSSLQLKANLLRKWALEAEVRFMDDLRSKDMKNWSEDEVQWVNELYKDILEQFRKSHPEIKKLADGTSFADKWKKVSESHEIYANNENTGRTSNWAGTSELIGLSVIFKRQVQAYGKDKIEVPQVYTDSKGHVLPYFERLIGRSLPICIFQCNGGGHYNQLRRKVTS